MEAINVPTPAPAANVAKTDVPAGIPGAKAPIPAKPDATQTAAEIKKLFVKGKEYDEEDLARRIEKGDGADRKFQEAAAARKDVEKVLHQLKTNPGKVLLNKALGHNPAAVIRELVKEAAEAGMDLTDLKKTLSEVMYEWIEEENLDPKDRELRQLRKEMEKRNAADKAAEEEQQRAQLQELTQKAYKTLDADITSALKDSGLPKSTFTVKRMAYYLDQAFKLKQEAASQGVNMRDPRASELIQFVRRDYENMFRDLYQNSDAETLIKLVGEGNVDKIREYDVNRFKQGQQQQKPTIIKKTEGAKPADNSKSNKDFLHKREEEIREMERKERGY